MAEELIYDALCWIAKGFCLALGFRIVFSGLIQRVDELRSAIKDFQKKAQEANHVVEKIEGYLNDMKNNINDLHGAIIGDEYVYGSIVSAIGKIEDNINDMKNDINDMHGAIIGDEHTYGSIASNISDAVRDIKDEIRDAQNKINVGIDSVAERADKLCDISLQLRDIEHRMH